MNPKNSPNLNLIFISTYELSLSLKLIKVAQIKNCEIFITKLYMAYKIWSSLKFQNFYT